MLISHLKEMRWTQTSKRCFWFVHLCWPVQPVGVSPLSALLSTRCWVDHGRHGKCHVVTESLPQGTHTQHPLLMWQAWGSVHRSLRAASSSWVQTARGPSFWTWEVRVTDLPTHSLGNSLHQATLHSRSRDAFPGRKAKVIYTKFSSNPWPPSLSLPSLDWKAEQ